jgi:hypothetical protein
MTDSSDKPSSLSRSKKFAIGISCGLVVLVLAFVIGSAQLEKQLTRMIEAKLTQVESLSIQVGVISVGISAVHIDQITIRPAGYEDGPGLVLSDIHADIRLPALMGGALPLDQIDIKRIAVLPDQSLALDDSVVSVLELNDSRLVLNFTGKTNPGQLSGTMELDRQSTVQRLRADLKSEALRIFHPRIARSPLEPIHADVSIDLRYDGEQKQLQIDQVKVSSQGVMGILAGQVDMVTSSPRLSLTLDIPSVPCQTLLEALPREFVPELQGFRLSGDFSAQYKLVLDFAKLEETKLSGYRGFRDCQTLEAPPHLSEDHFRGSFEHTTRLTVGINQTFQVGPENPDFVPFGQLSDALRGAFLATEDISFFQHAGYVADSLSLAIGQNLLANRFAMGGSTITMQMVKNVFLSHEKTLSRKVQELFLTDYVERSLGKERILEIYLNVIEFGPGIFGIGPAAQYYFGRPVSELNNVESVFLASIVYSPRRHHGSYCRGSVSKEWNQRLRQLLELMHMKELISEADFLASHEETVVFRKPALGCSKI